MARKNVDREKLVANLHAAVRAYIEGLGGKVWTIGPIDVTPHKPTQFDLIIQCVGERPGNSTGSPTGQAGSSGV